MSQSTLHDLIAHYIALNYPLALPPFLGATGTAPPDLTRPPVPDLPTLVADAQSEALAAEMARASLAAGVDGRRDGPTGDWDGWSLRDMVGVPLPESSQLNEVVRSIDDVSTANLLAVKVVNVPHRTFDTATAEYKVERRRSILAASADRALRVIDYETGEVDRILEPHKAPVLTFAQHPTNGRYLVSGSMDGTTVLTDLISGAALQTFRASKFVVRVAFSESGKWLATASYDHTVTVYEAVSSAHAHGDDEDHGAIDEGDEVDLAAEPELRYEQRHQVKLEANPEALLFHPQETWLLFTVRGSHELHYLRLPGDAASVSAPEPEAAPAATSAATTPDTATPTPQSRPAAPLPSPSSTPTWGIFKKNFNPHPLDTHVSFSVLDMALHPSGRIVACLTGDHSGPAGERVLLFGIEPDEPDRLACLWTGSSTDDYVLPRLAWLPDGTGIVTTSATGHLTLLSLSGEKRAVLKAHGYRGPGSGTSDVVRDVVVVPTEGGWEAASVGYDRRIRISR